MHLSIRRIISIATLVGGLLLYAGLVRADSEAGPRDFQVKSANGSYVLVVLPAYKFTRRDPALRARYKTSGVYKRENPAKPLYPVSPETRTGFLSGDGKYLVELGPWARRASDRAFAFYANGRKLREYRIEQLVADQLSLPHSVSHFMWLKDARLNDANRDFLAVTLDDRRYVFTLSTGLLKSGQLVGKTQQPEAIKLLLAGDNIGLRKLGKKGQDQLGRAIMEHRHQLAAQIVPALFIFGPVALPSLEAAAKHPDPEVRQLTVELASHLYLPQLAPVLRSGLTDSNTWIRVDAINGLYNIGFREEAVQAALRELKTKDNTERDIVLSRLDGMPAPELIPVIIDLVDYDDPVDPNKEIRIPAHMWLRSTTFQNIWPNTKANWSAWWSKNKGTSLDVWYRWSVDREIARLRTEDHWVADKNLTNLTGHSIPDKSQSATYKGWERWWQTNRSKSPRAILLASLATPDEHSPLSLGETLQRFVTVNDVPTLVALYEKANGWQKFQIEPILRRLTGIDSSSATFFPGDEPVIIQAWKQWIKDHPAGQATPPSRGNRAREQADRTGTRLWVVR